jgi:hypothetical protein
MKAKNKIKNDTSSVELLAREKVVDCCTEKRNKYTT